MLATLALLFCWTTASAYDFKVDGIYYNKIGDDKSTVEVTSGDVYYSGSIVIPSSVEYEGKSYPVTSIGDEAFSLCHSLLSVTIPNSVLTIGLDAFYECSGLKSATIPNSVTSIGESAFSDCWGLTDVTIGNSVKSIAEAAFYDCESLTTVTIGSSVESMGNTAFGGSTSWMLEKITCYSIIPPNAKYGVA